MSNEPLRDRVPPTHVLTIEVPLDLTDDGDVSAPLDGALALVRLAFPHQICDTIQLTLRRTDA